MIHDKVTKAPPSRGNSGYMKLSNHNSTKPNNLHRYEGSKGIAHIEQLPSAEFDASWQSIFVDDAVKSQLLNQAVLSFTLRGLRGSKLPLHGIIMLYGPPGTGKTTLARGCASQVAKAFDQGNFVYVEVDPHALGSAALGKSQKAVTDLFGTTLVELAATYQVIVLLDEVETLAAARNRLSLEANPVDVHRATDAVLTQVDALAHRNANILFLATSNFPEALDGAFTSRADLQLHIDLPTLNARQQIIADTLGELARHYPKLNSLQEVQTAKELAHLSDGLDGRRIRKAVISALTLDREVALRPENLTVEHLRQSFRAAASRTEGN